MENKYQYLTFLGLTFNVANCLSIILTALVVFFLVFFLSRKITMRPGKRQNVLEYLIDFSNGIVKSIMPGDEGKPFYFYIFVLFLFLLVSNILGLFLEIKVNGFTYTKSPTADPMVTMPLALMSLVLSHYYGAEKYGFKGYLSNFARPVGFMLPMNLIEEFTNFLTLSLRLYGNIFAGEVLIGLLVMMTQGAGLSGVFGSIAAIPLMMVWQGFSVFIGAVQAYIFATLTCVYFSRKITRE
ncbi:F0F1 ATP synthase subunit A [Lapidilactobacillus achengensis]|uniref:ATP synthase subunit a n=1 Tax=Lapidilactobacillus achengensis TaxID=2486000 RepID=A0ABW1URA6_9LACO|nr:F0F1 ATP synthase subunit A [Lapidilactobacillus achengensis]